MRPASSMTSGCASPKTPSRRVRSSLSGSFSEALFTENEFLTPTSAASRLSFIANSTSSKSQYQPYWPGVTGRHSPDSQADRPGSSEWIDVSDSAITAAIKVINPDDVDWHLTKASIIKYLKDKGFTEETNDILKPGVIDQMFEESDADGDGYIDKKELKIACSVGRYRYRKYTKLWVELVQNAYSTDMTRKHHKVEDCLCPRIQNRRDSSPVRQKIFAQFERPENYPKHCGYGPVDRGEYLTETLNAGMPARAAAWRSSLNFPAARRPSLMLNKCVGSSVLLPLDTPTDYMPPKDSVKLTALHSNTYPLPRRNSLVTGSKRGSFCSSLSVDLLSPPSPDGIFSPALNSVSPTSAALRLNPSKRGAFMNVTSTQSSGTRENQLQTNLMSGRHFNAVGEVAS